MTPQHRLLPEFARAVDEVFAAAEDEGIGILIVSTYRSSAEQSKLHRAWIRRGKTGLPAAPPGQSFHEFGLAVDFATDPPDALERVGEIAEDFGLRWGGRFNDPVHIDFGTVVNLREARFAFNPKRLVEVG